MESTDLIKLWKETQKVFYEKLGWLTIPVKGDKIPHIKEWTSIKNLWDVPPYAWNDACGLGIVTGEKSGVIILDIDKKNNGVEDWIKYLEKNGGDIQTPKARSANGGLHYYFRYNDRVKHLKNASCMAEDETGKRYPWDIRTDGGQAVMPGSVNNSGGLYEWEREYTVDELKNLMEMPDWVLKMMRVTDKPKKVKSKKIILPEIPQDVVIEIVMNKLKKERAELYDDWRNCIWAIKAAGLPIEIAHNFSQRVPEKYDGKGLLSAWESYDHEREDRIKTKKLLNYLQEDIGEEEYQKFIQEHNLKKEISVDDLFKQALYGDTDADFCNYFYAFVDADIIYAGKQFWVWNKDKRLWEERDIDSITKLCSDKITPDINKRHKEAFNLHQAQKKELMDVESQEKQVDKLEKDYKKYQNFIDKLNRRAKNVPSIKNMLTMLKGDITNSKIFDKMDMNHELLPIKGGKVFDFRKNIIRNREKEDYFSKEANAEYDPNADMTGVIEMMDNVTLGDTELKDFLQETLGACLTGYPTRNIYFWYNSNGKNAKTTITKLMQLVLGDFYGQALLEVFFSGKAAKNSSAASPGLASLRGCRMAVTSDMGNMREYRLEEDQLKKISGGDPLTARHLHKDPITFQSTFKPFIISNNRPECSTDPALWDRIQMVPFPCEMVPNPTLPHQRKSDPLYYEKVSKDEKYMKGFFRWLVEGAVIFMKRMIDPKIVAKIPACVQRETEEYKLMMNPYIQFVDDCIEITKNSKDFLSYAELNVTFDDWLQKNSLQSSNYLAQQRSLNFKRIFGELKQIKVEGYNKKCYIGIREIANGNKPTVSTWTVRTVENVNSQQVKEGKQEESVEGDASNNQTPVQTPRLKIQTPVQTPVKLNILPAPEPAAPVQTPVKLNIQSPVPTPVKLIIQSPVPTPVKLTIPAPAPVYQGEFITVPLSPKRPNRLPGWIQLPAFK